jgi:hypothetical protein
MNPLGKLGHEKKKTQMWVRKLNPKKLKNLEDGF